MVHISQYVFNTNLHMLAMGNITSHEIAHCKQLE